LTNWLVMQVVS